MFDRGTLTEAELIERWETRMGRPQSELSAIIDAVRESLDVKPDTLRLVQRSANAAPNSSASPTCRTPSTFT